jgi:hypothetical protein
MFPRVNVNVMVRGSPMGTARVPSSLNTPDASIVTRVAPGAAFTALMASVPIPAAAVWLALTGPTAPPPHPASMTSMASTDRT